MIRENTWVHVTLDGKNYKMIVFIDYIHLKSIYDIIVEHYEIRKRKLWFFKWNQTVNLWRHSSGFNSTDKVNHEYINDNAYF